MCDIEHDIVCSSMLNESLQLMAAASLTGASAAAAPAAQAVRLRMTTVRLDSASH